MKAGDVGHFWAIGVGPGDPDLLTLKAVRALHQVDVIYHAGPAENEGRALEVVRQHLRPDQSVRRLLSEPMAAVSASADRAPYRPGVEQIAADCRRGRNVAFITEGDSTLYSTASYVWQLLAELAPDIPVEIVPGVSSVTAAAARVGWPLAQRDEMLAVVPASYHVADVAEVIRRFPRVCLLKAASVLPELAPLLAKLGRRTVCVENVGTPREWISEDLAVAAGRREYFSLLLVQPEQARVAAGSGKLWIVGLGPGAAELLTRQAEESLRQADVVVGYEAYLRALAPLGLRAELRDTPIGAETERAATALELARAGRRVALVSSGDAGVYGMASLLLEKAESMPGVAVEVVPGVTAATAAAALLGAPLGHDFACVSLSDLLTPWEVIERRLQAVGQGDFVLALYNPVSRRRTWQLPRARDLLLKYRAPETPVGIVEKAYRPGTQVRQTTLGCLSTDGITMETLLIVGSRHTRLVNGRMVTPRGYQPRSSIGARSVSDGSATPVAHAPGSVSERSAPLPDGRGSSELGRQIMQESFTIIERELGELALPGWAFAVVRRMIHASADFDFARTLRYSPDFEPAVRAALSAGAPVVTDTEMVLLGIRTALAGLPATPLVCLLKDPEVPQLAATADLTRTAAGMRLAAQRYPHPILVLGNAPTAVEEALHQVENGWRPAAVIGMPVGFVGVEEAKRRLLEQTRVPYLTCLGRKGGSAVAAAALNALVELSQPS